MPDYSHSRIPLCSIVTGSEFGFSPHEQEVMKNVWRLLVYSGSEKIYDKHLRDLQSRLGEDHAFYKYIVKNWDSCKDMWVSYLRGEVMVRLPKSVAIKQATLEDAFHSE